MNWDPERVRKVIETRNDIRQAHEALAIEARALVDKARTASQAWIDFASEVANEDNPEQELEMAGLIEGISSLLLDRLDLMDRTFVRLADLERIFGRPGASNYDFDRNFCDFLTEVESMVDSDVLNMCRGYMDELNTWIMEGDIQMAGRMSQV